jgi:beta-lactamase regulating signal transducer with metallopeptidase domain
MTSFSEAIGYWLIDFYAVATVVFLAAFAIFRRLAQPARRLSVAWSAVAGLLALAVVTAIPTWPRARWSHWREPVNSVTTSNPVPASHSAESIGAELPRLMSQRDAVDDPLEPARFGRSASSDRAATRPPAGTATVPRTADWPAVGRWAFFGGAALMVIWLAVGQCQTVSVRRHSVEAPQWIREFLAKVVDDGRPLPDLRLSDRLVQPVAVGLVRPSIILPNHLTDQPPESRLDAALAHEWAHIRNRDLWLIALSRLLMPILFAHPAYWWLRGQICDDQEILADADAGANRRVDYASALLSWAQAAADRPRLAVAGSLALWERPSQLKRRIVLLLDHSFRVEMTCPRWWRVSVRAASALTVLSLSIMSFRPAPTLANPQNDPASQQTKPSTPPAIDAISKAGETVRVVDSQGKPVANANFYSSSTAEFLGQSGPDGLFSISAQAVKGAKERTIQIVAVADGFGPAFDDPSMGDGMKVLRLADDDVAIHGRLLDINGQGVAGASVQLVGFFWHPSGKLDEWLAALDAEKVAYPVLNQHLRSWTSTNIPSLYRPVVADASGRFTLRGVGRERLASLLISGPRIETRLEHVATRKMAAVRVPDFDRHNQSRKITYHGAEFDLVAGPCLEVTGNVTDKDTGKPVAGAIVQMTTGFGNPFQFLKTTTNSAGQYLLTGIPPKNTFGQTDGVLASVPNGPAYLPSVQPLDEKPAVKPALRNFALKRGVLVRGRVTDKLTGKPIRANLDYFILEDNRYVIDYPPYGTIRAGMPYPCDENGIFQLVVMPGRGVLGARFGNDTYRLGVGIENIKGLTEAFPGAYRAHPHYFSPANYNKVVEINAKPGDESVTADMQFERGRTVKGLLTGPDGKPVSGVLMMGAEDHFQVWGHERLPTAEFEVHALGPDAKRGLLFFHEAKKLAGAYVVKAGENGPIAIKLEHAGSLAGRLTEHGLPAFGVQMTCDRPYEMNESRYEHGSLPEAIKTGKDGRFLVVGLVPGLKYSLRVWNGNRIVGEAVKNVVVKPGETRDVGDVAPAE